MFQPDAQDLHHGVETYARRRRHIGYAVHLKNGLFRQGHRRWFRAESRGCNIFGWMWRQLLARGFDAMLNALKAHHVLLQSTKSFGCQGHRPIGGREIK